MNSTSIEEMILLNYPDARYGLEKFLADAGDNLYEAFVRDDEDVIRYIERNYIDTPVDALNLHGWAFVVAVMNNLEVAEKIRLRYNIGKQHLAYREYDIIDDIIYENDINLLKWLLERFDIADDDLPNHTKADLTIFLSNLNREDEELIVSKMKTARDISSTRPIPVVRPVKATSTRPVVRPVKATSTRPGVRPVKATSTRPVVRPVKATSTRPVVRPIKATKVSPARPIVVAPSSPVKPASPRARVTIRAETQIVPTRNTMNDYGTKVRRLGAGTYGEVFLYRTRAGREYAIKAMKIDGDYGTIGENIINDVSTLKLLDHPHIVKPIDIIIDPDTVYMVMPLASSDLRTYISSGGISWDDIPRLMFQLVDAMAYYFNMNVLHLDIKPQNVLVFNEGGQDVLKYSDFGLATQNNCNIYPAGRSTIVVTLWYRSIDIFLGDTKYDSMADIWAFGCVLYETYTGIPLFRGFDDYSTVIEIFKRLGKPTEEIWPGVSSLPGWKVFEDEGEFKPRGFDEKEIVERPELLDLLNLIFDYQNFGPARGQDHITKIINHRYFSGFNNTSYNRLRCVQTLEPKDSYVSNYFDNQPNIIMDYRTMILGWLYGLKLEWRLRSATVMLAYDIFDRFLSVRQISRERLQLIAIIALLLAAKVNEIYIPAVSDLIDVTGGAYSANDIKRAEQIFIRDQDWVIYRPTSYDFMNVTLRDVDYQQMGTSKYTLLILSMSPIVFELKPSDMAQLAIDLSYIYSGETEKVSMDKATVKRYIPQVISTIDNKAVRDSFQRLNKHEQFQSRSLDELAESLSEY